MRIYIGNVDGIYCNIITLECDMNGTFENGMQHRLSMEFKKQLLTDDCPLATKVMENPPSK